MSSRDDIFSQVQKLLNDVPVILMGSGVTVPMNIPGMWKLAEHLKSSLGDVYKDDEGWKKVVSDLDNDVDLENSLTGKNLSDTLMKDVALETWKFINSADLSLLMGRKNSHHLLDLSNLIKEFYSTSQKNVNIVTTNYDRAIEYACDEARLPVDKRFSGMYIKTLSTAPVKKKDIVNLFKIHGCLDLFSDTDGAVLSIPLQHDVPKELVPAIIAPGTSKYESVLVHNYNRVLLSNVDEIINNATSYLCYGYGFNDNHIQGPMLEQIKAGKPIVIVSREVYDDKITLIKKHSSNFIIIQMDAENNSSTRFTSQDLDIVVDGDYWSLGGFLSIFN
ncbi:MAG: SIR2 family protein [Defluviitaleaceae bacterium]|nr:SIR2 family protein [Defluviitaleaceae bacterium]